MNLNQTQMDAAKTVVCEKCGCQIMKNVFVIKSISGLLMPDGKETFIPVPTFACLMCDHINDKFAADLKLEKKE